MPDKRSICYTALMWLIVVICFLVLHGLASADIQVNESYQEHEPIVVTVAPSGIPEGAKIRGSVSVSGASVIDCGDNVFHVWAAPGTHTVAATGVWVVTQDVKVGDDVLPVLVDFGQYSYSKTFLVGDQKPDPTPPPGERRIVILEESKQRTPAQFQLWAQLLKRFPEDKIDILDQDQQKAAPLLKHAQGVPRPTLLVLAGPDDSLVRAVACPSSVAAVEQEVVK